MGDDNIQPQSSDMNGIFYNENSNKNALPLPPKNLKFKVYESVDNSNLNQESTKNTLRELSYVDMTNSASKYKYDTIPCKNIPLKLDTSQNLQDIPPPLPPKIKINKNLEHKVENTSAEVEENAIFLRNKSIHVIKDKNEKPNDPMTYAYDCCDDKSKKDETILFESNKPKEDISKIKSAIISGSYQVPLPLPTMVRSYNNDHTKKKNHSIKKLISNISRSSTEKDIIKKQKSRKENELIFEMFNNPLSEMEDSEIQSIKFAGMLILDSSRDDDETRVMINDGFIIWNEGKLEKKIRTQHIISMEALELKSNGYHQHMFELTWWEKQNGTRVQKFITRNLDERSTWMQKILESITSIFPQNLTCQFTRAGWLHVKEGTCGTWTACRMILIGRDLFYCINPGEIHTTDLRKAKNIDEYKFSELSETGSSDEESSLVLLELCERNLYLLSVNIQDTENWRICLRDAALRNGPDMNKQQLTKDSVPVIVDMCISYITMNGNESEGIYRRTDNGLAAQTLLLQFRTSAWSVNLIKQNNSVHVVATTLKMYFSELSEPLITMELAPHFRNVAMDRCDESEKISRYCELLQQLPEIHFKTSKILFMHLHILHRQSDKNKMNARHLADVWSPELIRQPLEGKLAKSNVIEDLIYFFPFIYNVSESEITQELQLQMWKERINQANESPRNPTTSDIIIHVQIGKYNSTLEKKIFLGDNKSAGAVCTELASELDSRELLMQGFMLLEYILGGELARPILNTEKVKDVVMRWQDWDVEDRKNNKLVFARCHFYADVMNFELSPHKQVCGELKFADTSKKEFKNYEFKVNQNMLICYKDKKTSNKLTEWNINEISWYLGFEHARKPHTKWFITFIHNKNKQNRSKEHPFFGYTIGGGSKEELLLWSKAFFVAAFYNTV